MTNKPWQTEKGRQPLTAVWRNGGCSASYDSFVVKQTVVLYINIYECESSPKNSSDYK